MPGGGFVIGMVVLYGWLIGALMAPPVIIPPYLTQWPDVTASEEA
tara:strand:- start:144 stop:278 length:135 start_codon:yes stop_codon:yes gene_type:complete